MKKILAAVMLFVLSCLPFYTNATEVETTPEKQAAVKWLMDQTKNKMSLYNATLVVENVYHHAFKQNLEPMLVFAVMKKESTFNFKAKSNAGAAGLMQVLPKYHRDKIGKRNIYDPSVNIEVGTVILKDCLTKHKGNMQRSLGCYLGGSAKKYTNLVVANRSQANHFVLFELFSNPIDNMVALN